MMLMECITHFESHRSQSSPNSLDLLCLRMAQVPRSQSNILAIIVFMTTTNNDNDMTDYLSLAHAHGVIMQL